MGIHQALGEYSSALTDISQNFRSVSIKRTTRTRPTGSIGIILMDFVGAATSDGVAVQGDLCPQAIIDNNYKYRMKRKGE